MPLIQDTTRDLESSMMSLGALGGNGGIHTRFNTYTHLHPDNRNNDLQAGKIAGVKNQEFFSKNNCFSLDLARLGHI